MSDISISYKLEEQAEARKLANALERRGRTVWWDPKLRAGEHFDDVIEVALEEAKCVIVMWSRLAVQSRYVKDEANYALSLSNLVPVAIEEVKNSHPQLTGWDGSENAPEFRRLVEDISAIIGFSATEPGEMKHSLEHEQTRKLMPQPIENSLEPGTVFRETMLDGMKGPEMLIIPPGQFKTGGLWGDGDETERPVHPVRIHTPFAL